MAATKAPDRAITVQILEAFSDYADFEAWLESTVSRPGAKGKILHMGPVPDRRAQSGQDVARKRQAAEKQEQEWRTALEQSRAAEVAAVAELDQPMPALEAYSRIQARLNHRGVPGR